MAEVKLAPDAAQSQSADSLLWEVLYNGLCQWHEAGGFPGNPEQIAQLATNLRCVIMDELPPFALAHMAEAKETPLIDLLRSVPEDATVVYDHHQFSSSNYAYGRMCHAAAKRITELEYRLSKANDDIQGERALHMNFVLDLGRVVNGDPTMCHFPEIENVRLALANAND